MAFLYEDIKVTVPKAGDKYIFDANVWIFYCNQVRPQSRAKPYTRFLNAILKVDDEPMVYLPAMVLSEVLNRLLKDQYCKLFLQSPEGAEAIKDHGDVKEEDYFKKIYRPHLQYYRDREAIITSIFSYSPKVFPCEDAFDKYDSEDFITSFTELDFGDWLIYEAAKDFGAVVVSHDGDFIVENQRIITNADKLLKLV